MPDQPPEGTESPTSTEPQWWEDPRLPWRGQPSPTEVRCWAAIGLVGIYGLVLLPLRPILLGLNPYLLATLTGSRTAMVTIGALTATTGGRWWPLGIALGTLGLVKFHPIFFWAGRLWGHDLIETLGARSPRAQRNAARAERLASRFGALAVVATFVVPFLPYSVVFATVGAAGMRWRTFLSIDLGCALVLQVFWVALGYRIGQPAVEVVKVIATYSWWIALVLLAGIIIGAIVRSAGNRADRSDPAGEAETD